MKMKRTLTSKSLSLTSLIALDLSQNGHESPSPEQCHHPRNKVTIRDAFLIKQPWLPLLLSDSHSVPTGSGFIGFDVTLLVNQIREDLIDNDLEKQG
ncbi:hypothetical protein BLNAU_23190 [Blattamonas nauphoetae]|uniref:Uncharacterized protein n=1 Tax=Blattamonas nauphoetae TaxID=2049346 RepID=A0ABQ9WPE9_9EUKA|nr:hypothetical protein BLNAU_23732 [Blattamonas nauphoetae]KAK2941884.1 hypothetical protein BLNAU_23190 [Blattamonas nauphoetae]